MKLLQDRERVKRMMRYQHEETTYEIDSRGLKKL